MGSDHPIWSRTGRFESDVDSPARARAFARETMALWGLEADDVILVLSELVSNVVSHVEKTKFVVDLTFEDGLVHVSVTDPGSGWPSISPIAGRSGRGLRIVNSLAMDWGVERNESTKTVWADMPLSQLSF